MYVCLRTHRENKNPNNAAWEVQTKAIHSMPAPHTENEL